MLTCPTFGFFVFGPKADLPDMLTALIRFQIKEQGPLWRDPRAAR